MQNEKVARASRLAAVLTAVGFVIVMGAVVYGAVRLGSLDGEIAAKQSEIKRANEDLEALYATLDSVRTQIEHSQYADAKDVLDASIRPRVYVHTRRPIPLTKRIRGALEEEGFVVPKEEIIVDQGPSKNQVRYFRQTEKSEAEEIKTVLRDRLGIDDVVLSYLPGYETSRAIRPRHYEIWLAPPDVVAD